MSRSAHHGTAHCVGSATTPCIPYGPLGSLGYSARTAPSDHGALGTNRTLALHLPDGPPRVGGGDDATATRTGPLGWRSAPSPRLGACRYSTSYRWKRFN